MLSAPQEAPHKGNHYPDIETPEISLIRCGFHGCFQVSWLHDLMKIMPLLWENSHDCSQTLAWGPSHLGSRAPPHDPSSSPASQPVCPNPRLKGLLVATASLDGFLTSWLLQR